ncbi:MAG: hypothetical protein Q4P08_06310 [Eubacteriales bacterium]|nr:hypothetical protein [Eubacteriales bacterium]
MSRQIGPIHHLMYDKIHYQESITQALLRAFEAGLQEDIQQKMPEIAQGELATVIDFSNVHGWLEGQVKLAERRYAWTVSKLLKRGVSEQEISQIVKSCAIDRRPEEIIDAVDALEKLSQILLDGMPCDQVVEIHDASTRRISYSVENQVHAPYWLELAEDPELFYRLRRAWIETWLEGSGYEFVLVEAAEAGPLFAIQLKAEQESESNAATEQARAAKARELYQPQCDHEH